MVLNLSSTVASGRYNIKYRTTPVLRHGAKTIVTQLPNGQESLVRKDSVMNVISDFDNDRISHMQYFTLCYEEDLDECIKKLEKTMLDRIKYLHRCNTEALLALGDLKIIKEI